ncbi:YadA C-terminal domain-containing protein, partial [uncultured Veillonella sp.]|uniref:YadA C-terminal domain-containing protein n=1 Tax=uncultured Veillonella sp. TaxID=159268 RepID=UPI00261F4F82
ASNLTGDTNINNWKTKLGITNEELGQASAWTLYTNMDKEKESKRIISKDSVINFIDGESTEVTVSGNDIKVDLNQTTKNQIKNNTEEIKNIKTDVNDINNRIDNIVTKDGNLKIQGDETSGVIVGPADGKDSKNGLKVSLGDTIKVGDATLSGKVGNSTLTGLSNTSWDESNFQADRAATEGQLKDFMGKVNENVAPTKIKGDANIHVKELSKNNFELSLDKDLKVDNSISVGGNTYINNEGINANDKPITNVGESELVAGSNNAATVNQVVEVRDELKDTIGNVAGVVQDNMRQMAKLDDRMNKVGAGAAALAGLHPLEFNPDDKFSAAVAMGSYKGQGAAALGGFYRPNADTMFSVASTIGDEAMFNIGVSLKFGDKGDDIYRNANATNIGALTNEVASLKAENKGLADQVASQKAELEQQRALIQQLMAKVGM